MALWPIVLVIIAAVFTYNLCVRTGAMDVIGSMITSISSDRRLLALLVAWCFGGFMEGMAGFGTAVAIPAGMLAGLIGGVTKLQQDTARLPTNYSRPPKLLNNPFKNTSEHRRVYTKAQQ